MDQSKKRGKHWYTRHHMWMNAVSVRERSRRSRPDLLPLDYLDDLLDDPEYPERREALEATVRCLSKNPSMRKCGGVDFIEQGMGPSNRDELRDEELGSYNGVWGWPILEMVRARGLRRRAQTAGYDIRELFGASVC